MDGDQLELPASDDVIEAGYRGYPSSHQRETHYPKMYTAQALDVLNGLIVDFKHSNKQDEVYLAREMVAGLESNSLTLYDRLHCGYWSFLAHFEAGNYFLVRARSEGTGCSKVVRTFRDSTQRSCWVDWIPKPHYGSGRKPLRVRLIKVRNPRTKEDLIFVTNLPDALFSLQEIATLYQRRWLIETSFRDLTHTLKMNQWHSTKINGIFQEIFALLWLVNEVRLFLSQIVPDHAVNFLEKSYSKSNLKFCLGLVMEHLSLLITGQRGLFLKHLVFWENRTREKRRHMSRSYPRVVRHRGREYVQANLVPRRSPA